MPAVVAQAVERLQAALVATLGPHHPGAVVRAHQSGKDKEVVVGIDGVPFDHLAAVLDALKSS